MHKETSLIPLVRSLAEVILKVLSLEYGSQELQEHWPHNLWLTGIQLTVIHNYKTVLTIAGTSRRKTLLEWSPGLTHMPLNLLAILPSQ